MVVRALGYKNVVETSGTWPTNYMTKAVELGLLEDVVGSIGGSLGASRGNIAIILWNMLNRPMWVVVSENQTTGITYGKSTKTEDGKTVEQSMLEIKFPGYELIEGYVQAIALDDGDVMLKVKDEDTEKDYTGKITSGDLLTLGFRKVVAVYNEDDEEFLTVAPLDTVVMGRIDEKDSTEKTITIDEKEYDVTTAKGYTAALLNGVNVGDYGFLVLESKEVIQAKLLTGSFASEIIDDEPDEPTSKGKYTIGTLIAGKKDEDVVVIRDGEWASLGDIEKGDVVSVFSNEWTNLIIVKGEEVEGTVSKLIWNTNDKYITVDGEKYTLDDNSIIVEEVEDEDDEEPINVGTFATGASYSDERKDLKDTEVVLTTDFLGRVLRIDCEPFDGEKSTSIGFYVATSGTKGNGNDAIWETSTEDGIVYKIKLMNEDGEETYTIDTEDDDYEPNTAAKDLDRFDLVFVTFNKDGDVINISDKVATTNTFTDDDVTYAAIDVDGKLDDKYIGAYKLTSSSVLVEYTWDDNDTEDDGSDDFISKAEFIEDALEALDGMKSQTVTIIHSGEFKTVNYVVTNNTAKASDLQLGILDIDGEENTLGELEITIDDEEINVADTTANAAKSRYFTENAALVYSLNEDDELDFVAGISKVELANIAATSYDGIVEDVEDGRRVKIHDSSKTEATEDIFDFDKLTDAELAGLGIEDEEKATYILLIVAKNGDVYENRNMEMVDFEDVSFEKGDRLSIDENEDVVFIIRGVSTKNVFDVHATL